MQQAPVQQMPPPQPQQQYVGMPVGGTVFQPATQARVRPGYASQSAKVMGITQVSLGAAAIVLQAVAIGFSAEFYFVGHGIWCGVVFIIAGGLTIPAAIYKNTCLIVASMVMSIIAAVLGGVLLCLAAGEISSVALDGYYYWSYLRDGARYAIHSLMLLVALLEMVASIWTASLACKGTCCMPSVMPGDPVYQVQYTAVQGGQMMPMMVVPGSSAGPQQGMIMYTVPQTAINPNATVDASAPPPTYSSHDIAGQPPSEVKVPLQ